MNVSRKIIALTGATGFVGRALLTELQKSYEVKTLDLRRTKIDELDLNGVETVIHCAALVHQMHGASKEEYFKINTTLTEQLARTAKNQGVGQFIFLSTSHVYGEYGDCFDHSKRLREDDPCTPTDPYGESKLAAEKLLTALQSPSFIVSIIRSPMVYGEGAKGNLRSLCKLIKAIPVLPFGETENQRSLIYVGNLVHFILQAAIKKPSGLLLAQDQTPLSIHEIVSYLAENMNVQVKLFRLPRPAFLMLYRLRPNIMKRLFGTLAMDSTRTNQVLSYRAPYTSQEGFRRMMKN